MFGDLQLRQLTAKLLLAVAVAIKEGHDCETVVFNRLCKQAKYVQGGVNLTRGDISVDEYLEGRVVATWTRVW